MTSTTHIEHIQTTLDNFKQQMHEQAYISLCNTLKKYFDVNKEKESSELVLCKAKIVRPKVDVPYQDYDSEVDCCAIRCELSNVYLELKKKKYDETKAEIAKNGHSYLKAHEYKDTFPDVIQRLRILDYDAMFYSDHDCKMRAFSAPLEAKNPEVLVLDLYEIK